MFEILVATNNDHKLDEYKELFKGYDVALYSLKDFHIVDDPIEDGNSYEENSLIKAKSVQNSTEMVILADDSGIEIDALGENLPGIFSKRYAESHGGSKKYNEFLSKNHYGSEAHFTCCIVLLNLKDEPLYFIGKCYGEISKEVTANNGFGYDPIFIPKGFNKTFGELTKDEKNKISHRANATNKLIEYLKNENLI